VTIAAQSSWGHGSTPSLRCTLHTASESSRILTPAPPATRQRPVLLQLPCAALSNWLCSALSSAVRSRKLARYRIGRPSGARAIESLLLPTSLLIAIPSRFPIATPPSQNSPALALNFGGRTIAWPSPLLTTPTSYRHRAPSPSTASPHARHVASSREPAATPTPHVASSQYPVATLLTPLPNYRRAPCPP
jgi:hypothetical protein